MKQFALIILVGLAVVGTLAGQPNPPKCPSIYIIGPAGIIQPGASAIYRAHVGVEALPQRPRFQWSIAGGEISKGQGKLEIEVQYNSEAKAVRVNLQVLGLPEGCVNTASELVYLHREPHKAILIGGISVPVDEINEAALSDYADELLKNPYDAGYIIEYVVGDAPEAVVKKKITRVIDFLVRKKTIQSDRITIVVVESASSYTELFRVPPGAENPKPPNPVLFYPPRKL